MTITATSLIQDCATALQDLTSIRWPVKDLVRYLNDGQREIITYRPDSLNTTASLACTPGARQTLPNTMTKVIEILANTSGSMRSITLVHRKILDTQLPTWRSQAGSTDLLHYCSDPRTPRVFEVYPPAATGASVDGVFAMLPADVTEPAAGAQFSAVAGNISVSELFKNPLMDYILFRAYSKDAEYAGNTQRAADYYAAYAAVLGIELKATIAVGPANATAV